MTPYRIATKFWNVLTGAERGRITSTLEALMEAELEDVAAQACERMFAKEVDDVLVIDGTELAPFVRFALDDLLYAATARGWTSHMRRTRAEQALGAWGF